MDEWVNVRMPSGVAQPVSIEIYNAVVQDFARTRMIGRAVPCPGCDWDGCVDCNPELEPEVRVEGYKPAHTEWLQPEDVAAIHKAIDEIEARLGD